MPESDDHGHVCECGENFQNPDKLQRHIQLQGIQPRESHSVRQPTEEELKELADWYHEELNYSYSEASVVIGQCFHIVVENYTTGCPGYSGKLLIAIGEAAPAYHSVYTWHETGLQRRNQAEEIRQQTVNP